MTPKLSPEERIELIEQALKGESITKLAKVAGISRVLFYRWLKRFKEKGREGLEPQKGGRPRKIQAPKRQKPYHYPTDEDRLRMVKEVLEEGKKATEIAKKYGVSRVTLYKWINRYMRAPEEEKAQAVRAKTPQITRYWRQTPEKYEKAVLSLIAEHPEYGIRRLVANLPKVGETPIVGHHGVQNILRRYNLSTYEQRIAYAQAQVTPVTRVIGATLAQISRFFSIPIESRSRIIRFAGAFALSAFITIVVFGFGSYLVHSMAPIPGVSRIGMVFASIALLMGSIFFLYSFKYYITLAVVLSFSQQRGMGELANGNGKRYNFLSWILGLANGNGGRGDRKRKNGRTGPVGLEPNLEFIKLKKYPKVSIHIPFYNEKNVVERALTAIANLDYPEYEVIFADDSTDETREIIRNYQKDFLAKGERLKETKGDGWKLTQVEVKPGVIFKHLHRTSRDGFKGGALSLALTLTDPKAEFVTVFDADFVPYPDTLELFLKYFKVQNNMSEDYKGSNVAAVQGYQWHVLNKSENWVTRGVRAEYAGSYVVERSGREIYGALKQISGSVYMIRRDVLEEVGWETSITEDFQLTLKLYEKGYKVVYTPYIQAPAECVSTLRRLIRQRMRWAEGHSNNIRRMFRRLIFNDKLTSFEKLEFLYLSPYYLQAFFFLTGSFSWLLSETIFPARLPFWASLWGWSLVLTNLLSLPLMNAVGLFLEESEERDYLGLLSFLALSYILVPFQAYASLKGFLKREEGPWFRTPKTGLITDVFTRGKFYRFISGILPGRTRPSVAHAQSTTENSQFANKYFALATANNQFNAFSIRPRKKKWLGKAALSLLLVFTVTVYSATRGVPEVLATNPTGPFYLSNDDSTVISGTASWQLLDNTLDSPSDSTTQVDIAKNGPAGRAFRYPPGTTNNNSFSNASTCSALGYQSGSGEGWIFDTPFGGSGGSIASGTWTFYIYESDNMSAAAGGAIICVWEVTITSNQIDTGGTLMVNIEDTTPSTNILDNAVSNVSYTANPGEITMGANTYMYVEYWVYMTDRPSANASSNFYTGDITGEDPRIITPAVTIPEKTLLFLTSVPLIPYLVHLFIKRKEGMQSETYDN